MKKVVVTDIEKSIENDKVALSAQVDIQGWKIPDRPNPPDRIVLQFPGNVQDMIAERGDAFVACFLLQCMAEGSDLCIKAPVSSTLLENMHTMQDIWCAWNPDIYKRINISADSVVTSEFQPDKTAAFVSLGVESFDTLVKNKKMPPPALAPAPSIDYLIFIRGFERRLDEDKSDEDLIVGMISQVAELTNCRPIFCRTNFREFTSLNWGVAHGGAEAAAALALGAMLKTVLIAGNRAYHQLGIGSGTHPLTDPLWSTRTLNVIHDGCEATRQAKVVALVKHMPEFLNFLHVCWSNIDARVNCGHCVKCMDTMIILDVLGKLGDAHTFPDQLPGNFARNLLNFPRINTMSLRESAGMARERGDHRYFPFLEQIARIRTADRYRQELYPRWDRLTRPLRNLCRRIRYY